MGALLLVVIVPMLAGAFANAAAQWRFRHAPRHGRTSRAPNDLASCQRNRRFRI